MAYDTNHLLTVGHAKQVYDNLKSAVTYSSQKIIDLTPDLNSGYIDTSGGVGTTVTPTVTPNSPTACVIVPCHSFDTFMITGNGGTSARLWCLTDTDYKILKVSGPNASATNLKLNAEQDGYLICNFYVANDRSIAQYTYYDIESLLPVKTTKYVDYTHVLLNSHVGYYINSNVNINATVTYTPQSSTSNNRYIILPVKQGDIFIISGLGGQSARLYAFVDANDKLLEKSGNNASKTNFEIKAKQDGKLIVNITNVQTTVPYLAKKITVNANDADTTPDTDILFWGDSLTAGVGSQASYLNYTTFPAVCGALLNRAVMNCGVGGESSNTVSARQGGNTIIIPVGDVNGDYSGFTDVFGSSVAPLLQGDGGGSKLYINGELCNLAYASSTYTISGYSGDAITVPTYGRFVGSDYTGDVVVIFVGTNGSSIESESGLDARLAIIDSMIAHIGHNRYIIMGLSVGTTETRSSEDNTMLKKYGNRFFPTRKMLVANGLTLAGITPTAQDETDVANGTVPTSLRADNTHLNKDGYIALGTMIADKIVSLGF